MRRGKKYVESAKLVDRAKLYDPAEALDTVIKTAKAKFDETVEVHVKLGVDSRHADQQVRGAIVLPHGTGKKVRVLVFAKGDKAKLRPPEPIMWALKIWWPASPARTSLISMWSSPLPT